MAGRQSLKQEYHGKYSGVISAACARRWQQEAQADIFSIDRMDCRPAKCLMFMLHDKAGSFDSVVTHELSTAECLPSAIWPIVRDVMFAAGGRSATSDGDLRALCNGQKNAVRLPVSSTGYTMHITMMPTLRSASNAGGMAVWKFSGQSSGKITLLLAPEETKYNRVLSSFFKSIDSSGSPAQIEYSILLEAPPLLLGTATCAGADLYCFARTADVSYNDYYKLHEIFK